MSTRRESQRRDQTDGNGRVPSRQGSGLANVHSEARENRGGSTKGNNAQAGRSLSRTTSPTPNGGSDLGGASATHGGSLRWGFLHPDGAVASPRVGRGGGGFSAQWFNTDPHLPGAVRSSKMGSHMGMSGLQPVLADYGGVSGNVEQSGAIMPMELPSQAIAGGHTTRDLGKTLSKTQMGDSMTKPFTEEVVSYKHGDNIILHQWADTGDLLVNCQSPTPQSFICQYGVSKGTMAWTLDVSRTCDKFWFGVTTDKDLDCNGWISDCDAAFMVSEEGEVPESTYDNYVPRSVRDRPARPSMVQQNDSPPRWVRLKSFAPAAGIQGIWASVAFVLDMDKGELHMQVRNGDGDTSPKCKLFRGLPRGFTLYPCLSMCNAGQVIFMKYGE